jgi:hypothetical protein
MQHVIPTRRHCSAFEVRQLMARFRQSGLSQALFALNEGLDLSTLQRHLKRSRTLPAEAAALPSTLSE